MLAGTPAYLAPEVARGQEAGFPADVFSLGSTLYTAVEGVPPFGLDDNPLALLFRIANSEVTPPNKAGPLTSVLAELLERDVSRRPSMQQARHALTSAAAASPAFAVFTPPARIPAAADSLPTTPFLPLPAPGPSAPVPQPPNTGTTPATGVQGGEAPTPRPSTQGVTRPRHSAAAILAVVAALLVAGALLGTTLIYDGNNTRGTAVSPPGTAPGTAQNLQAPQPSPTTVAPILAPRAKPGPPYRPKPSPTRSPEPSPASSLTPSSQLSPAPSSPSSLELSPPPSMEPSPTPSPEPTAEPTLEPTAEPTLEPTAEPTQEPTAEPTLEPTAEPTLEPTPTPRATT
jgi:hypothetical protein